MSYMLQFYTFLFAVCISHVDAMQQKPSKWTHNMSIPQSIYEETKSKTDPTLDAFNHHRMVVIKEKGGSLNLSVLQNVGIKYDQKYENNGGVWEQTNFTDSSSAATIVFDYNAPSTWCSIELGASPFKERTFITASDALQLTSIIIGMSRHVPHTKNSIALIIGHFPLSKIMLSKVGLKNLGTTCAINIRYAVPGTAGLQLGIDPICSIALKDPVKGGIAEVIAGSELMAKYGLCSIHLSSAIFHAIDDGMLAAPNFSNTGISMQALFEGLVIPVTLPKTNFSLTYSLSTGVMIYKDLAIGVAPSEWIDGTPIIGWIITRVGSLRKQHDFALQAHGYFVSDDVIASIEQTDSRHCARNMWASGLKLKSVLGKLSWKFRCGISISFAISTSCIMEMEGMIGRGFSVPSIAPSKSGSAINLKLIYLF